jgi:protein required for attachment to host cells
MQFSWHLNSMPPTNTNSDGYLLPNERTFIVACSGAEARIFLAERRFGEWSPRETLENPGAALREQERNTDRPGRVFDSFGKGRHAMSQEESGRDHELQHFAGDIAHYLGKAHSAGQFKQLVLIAEPSLLGFLRRKLSPPLKRVLSFEVPKNPADFDVERLKSFFK